MARQHSMPSMGALLAVLSVVCAPFAVRGDDNLRPGPTNSTGAHGRTFPYGSGSLSRDGRYLCFTSASLVNTYTAACTASSSSYDSYGYCSGSVGSYYCNVQYSYPSYSVQSQSTSYNNGGGRCYESPGGAYADTPCLWNDIRMDYDQTGACSGTYSGVYVYYCPASYSSMNSYAGVTSYGQSGTTCYLTASECSQSGCSNSCLYDSESQCIYSGGYYAYCPSSGQPYAMSTLGALCYNSQSGCDSDYGVTCEYDSTVCSGAGSGYYYYSPSSSLVYSYVGTSGGSSDGYCYASLAAANYQSGCTSGGVSQDYYRSGACSGAASGFTYYCPGSSATYVYSSLGVRCFATSTACANYGYASSTCTYDTSVCPSGSPYYSTSSSLTYSYAYSSSTYCYVSSAAAAYYDGCSSPLRDTSNNAACSGAATGFTYYCSASPSPPPPPSVQAAPAPMGVYTTATYTNCFTYNALVSPLNSCGATATVAACKAICDATPGCSAIKYAGRMNTVPPCGAGNSWCMLLAAGYSSCSSSSDIWDMYYRSTTVPTPSPPPPPPPPTSTSSPSYVSATATLGGYSVTTFGTAQAAQFKGAVAIALSVSSSVVAITSVMAPAGRHLLQSSVSVAFTVTTTSSAASSVSSALTVVTGTGAVSMFQSAGLTSCTFVVVSTPSTGSTAPVDATSSLPFTVAQSLLPSSSPSSSTVIKPVVCLIAAASALAAHL
jgi:hypothetical protein